MGWKIGEQDKTAGGSRSLVQLWVAPNGICSAADDVQQRRRVVSYPEITMHGGGGGHFCRPWLLCQLAGHPGTLVCRVLRLSTATEHFRARTGMSKWNGVRERGNESKPVASVQPSTAQTIAGFK